MGPLENLSIRKKIIGIILLTNFVGLAIAFGLITRRGQEMIRQSQLVNASLLARIVGTYNAVHLAFSDVENAVAELGQLKHDQSILEAYIFDESGGQLASFISDREERITEPIEPYALLDEHGRFRDGYLEVCERALYERDMEETFGVVCLRTSTEPVEQILTRFYRDTFYVGLLVILVSTVFALMLGRVISGPILQLADVARRISMQNDYSIRVRKIGRDEIATLCDVFNDMLNQIQRRQQELERSNQELDHFAYVTSHDLKAPLRAISTLSSWIEEDLGDKVQGESAQQLELLRGRVKRMEGLIDGILEYSRVGRMDADVEMTDVGELLDEIVELLGLEDNVTIQAVGPMPTFLTKRLRLQQVLSNLISNAVKYNGGQAPRVEVSVQPKGDLFEFTVADNGPGIAPEYHEKIFMIFQTLQSRDEVESSGVGLALVKRIVEGEGGTIELDSDVGRGATFRFTWPR